MGKFQLTTKEGGGIVGWLFFLSLFLQLFCNCLATAETLVRVGIYDNPPMVFETGHGTAAGLFPDVLSSIAKERQWDLEYVPGSWQDCLARVEKGEIDFVVDIARTEERISRFQFSQEPVLTNWGAVYTRKEAPILSFPDLENKTVAVVTGSSHTEGVDGFRHLIASFGISCRYVEVDSYRKALMLLDNDLVDACVINRLFGALYAEDYDVSATPMIFGPKTLLFAGKKGDEHSSRLLRQIDQSLRILKKDPDSIYHHALGYYLGGGRKRWQDIEASYLQPIALTEEEKRWITENPVVRIGIDSGFAPFEFLSQEGNFEGMAADYLELIAAKTGLVFERLEISSWQDVLAAARAGEIDLLPCVVETRDRQDYLLFTEPYIQFSRVIITRRDGPLEYRMNDLSDLEGLKIGVQAGSSHHDFLKSTTDLPLVLYKTFDEAVVDLSKGNLDAVVGNLAVAHHTLRRLSLSNLKFAGYASSRPQDLRMGIRKDRPELATILNKALASITFREKNRILVQWFPLPTEAQNTIKLTTEEREWLLMNPKVRVGWDRNWAPIEFADEHGNPQGISMEYLFGIGEMLGIEFDMGSDVGWAKQEELAEKREVDMMSCVAVTPQRMKYLNFTDVYLRVPVVIFARDSLPYVNELTEIRDKKVAVVRDYAIDHWLSHDFPEMSLHRVDTLREGFRLLKRGEIDAFLCAVLPGNYYLSSLLEHGIKIAGETPYSYKLRMAIRNDWPELMGILQKALQVLPEVDKTYFYRKWALVKYDRGFDYQLIKKIIIILILLIAAVTLWNRVMAVEIRRRKRVEEELAASEQQLKMKNKELEKMEVLKDNLTHMIIHDMRSPLTAIGAALHLMGKRFEQVPENNGMQQSLDLAKDGVEVLSRMMQSILDIFKLESQQLPLHREQTDLLEIAGHVHKEMASQVDIRNQRLLVQGQSSYALVDKEIMRRVLTNLIENAIKATPEGGKIEVQVRSENEHGIITVKDMGRGIPVQFREKIFDKFSRLEKDTTSVTASYGLGLAFCRLAVQAHDGVIGVDCPPEGGSVFTVTLPKISP